MMADYNIMPQVQINAVVEAEEWDKNLFY